MSRPVVGVWLVTAIWLVVAGGLWAFHDYQLRNGTEIALKTAPVDPRDLLRGDYVVLRYDVSRLTPAEDRQPWAFAADQVVYVPLIEAQGEWVADGLERYPPEDRLYLRGRIRSSGTDWAEVVYGIESFFVPEGEGLRYEEARNRDRLWAVLSVSPHGVGYLKRLEIR